MWDTGPPFLCRQLLVGETATNQKVGDTFASKHLALEMPQPYKLFTIYAREDAQYLEELRGQLRPLEHAGRIRVWSDRKINPGVDWEREIIHNFL